MSNKIVYLNVGGVFYDTTYETLTKYENSYFIPLLSGKFSIEKDRNDRIFIDRNGKTFKKILNFLRNGVIEDSEEVEIEMKYFGLPLNKNVNKRGYLIKYMVSEEYSQIQKSLEEEEMKNIEEKFGKKLNEIIEKHIHKSIKKCMQIALNLEPEPEHIPLIKNYLTIKGFTVSDLGDRKILIGWD